MRAGLHLLNGGRPVPRLTLLHVLAREPFIPSPFAFSSPRSREAYNIAATIRFQGILK